MAPILITGGAGFIGSNFAHAAIAAGADVINLDALTYAGNLDSLAGLEDRPEHVFVHGSINDRGLLERLFTEHHPRTVVNFAAESHVDRSIDTPEAFVRTNVDGSFTLLETALDYWNGLEGSARDDFRLLHVSTDEVYGSIAEGRFTEESPYAPNSPYAASKAAADHLMRAYHRTYGLPVLVTNCGNNFGPRQFPEKLIPLALLNALEDKPIPVYGDGKNMRDWIYVDDHCAALSRVLEAGRPGETYLVGGAGGEQSNLAVVEALCTVLDDLRPRPGGARHAELVTFVADRPGHDWRYAIDPGKIASELGWQPETSFAAGLLGTVTWYLDNEPWWQAIRAGTYQSQRLGLHRRTAGQ